MQGLINREFKRIAVVIAIFNPKNFFYNSLDKECSGGVIMAKEAAAKPAAKPLSKTQLIAAIAESTKLSKKDVTTVIDALSDQIKGAFVKKGTGVFMFPGLFKITTKEVAKKPAQKNVKNPLTGEVRDIPARPAYKKPKLTALKALKDLVKNGK